MGVLLNLFLGYQEVIDFVVWEKFVVVWGVDLVLMDDQVGICIIEVLYKVLIGEIKVYYIMGEDLLQIEVDFGLVCKGIEVLDFVVVQDIFMIKMVEIVDVLLLVIFWGEYGGVFICVDCGFQWFEQVIFLVGNVKCDWEIISLLVSEMGYLMYYENNQQIWDEMCEFCLLFYGVIWEKMGDMGYVQWLCLIFDYFGMLWLYKDNCFDILLGKGQLFVIVWCVLVECLDDEWLLVFCIVWEVGYYFCCLMIGNCVVLQLLVDELGWVQMNFVDV